MSTLYLKAYGVAKGDFWNIRNTYSRRVLQSLYFKNIEISSSTFNAQSAALGVKQPQSPAAVKLYVIVLTAQFLADREVHEAV